MHFEITKRLPQSYLYIDIQLLKKCIMGIEQLRIPLHISIIINIYCINIFTFNYIIYDSMYTNNVFIL